LRKFGYILKQAEGVAAEFQLLPLGEILLEGEDPVILDEQGIKAIIETFGRRGNDMVIDYEHQTMHYVQAPAAGWIKRMIDRGTDGLWVTVEWTARAMEYLKNREYRYFSPVFWFEEGTRRVFRIQNVALTNDPLINSLKPIMAKMSLEEAREAREARSRKYRIGIKEGGHVTKPSEWEHVPDDEWLDPVNYRYPCPDAAQTRAAAGYWGREDNQAQYNPEERSIINGRLDKFRKKFNIGEFRKEEGKMEFLKKLTAKLGLKAEATEDQVIEAMDAMLTKNTNLEKQAAEKPKEVVAKEVIEALDLKDTDGVSTVVASIHALKQTGKGTVSREDFDKLQKDLRKRDADGIVAKATAEGKITPDQKDWAAEYAERDLEGFKTFVAKAPVVVPVKDLAKKEIKADDVIADEAVLNVAKMFGNTSEDIKKYGGIQ